MKNILLIYPPFCTPASPPYSVTNLYSFLKNNCNDKIDVLDLNLEFHKLKFPEYQKYYQDKNNWKNYAEKTKEFIQVSGKTYSENNKKVLTDEKLEFFDELLKKIKDRKPDIVAFSIVYSSHAFYANALIRELQKSNIHCVIGGPAVNEKLIKLADKTLNDGIELLEYITQKKAEYDRLNFNSIPDFSIYNLIEYFTPSPAIPIKTSNTCYYKKCAFCTHYSSQKYHEYDLDLIKKTIISSKQKYFFLVDEMIPLNRLLSIAEMLKPLNINWTVQLRPTKEFDYEALKKLRDSGMTMIMWGVESGNDRLLKLMNKGTNIKDIKQVLEDSHNAGIKNVAYILFGFPTETKPEFLETIEFLKVNQKYIDLVSVSVFGLQKDCDVFNNPEKFGIKKIIENKRNLLDSSYSYEVAVGLSQEQANRLRGRYKRTLEKINKYPKTMNFFREHMICLIE